MKIPHMVGMLVKGIAPFMGMKLYETHGTRLVLLNRTEAAVATILRMYGHNFTEENATEIFLKEGCTEADITSEKIDRALASLSRKLIIRKRTTI